MGGHEEPIVEFSEERNRWELADGRFFDGEDWVWSDLPAPSGAAAPSRTPRPMTRRSWVALAAGMTLLGAVALSAALANGESVETSAEPSGVIEVTAPTTTTTSVVEVAGITETTTPVDHESVLEELLEATETTDSTTTTLAPESNPLPIVMHPGVEAILADLSTRIAPANDRPYDRDAFNVGLDLDEDCQRTRHEVLVRDGDDVTFYPGSADCRVESGVWRDPFTGSTLTHETAIQVDHVVALNDAWDSGASQWDAAQQAAFGNDERNMVALAASENQAKGSDGPADYTPEVGGCHYGSVYAQIKNEYDLTITQEDYDAVAALLLSCPFGPLALPGEAPSPTSLPGEIEIQPIISDPSPEPTPTQPPPTEPPTTAPPATAPPADCHPSYDPCIPNLPGDALNCSTHNLPTVRVIGPDSYRLDRDNDGWGCE